jgi:GNAT superfamily N-acetyltransferase
MEEEGRVVAYGAVILTGEEAYRAIEGRWLSEEEDYVVVHRLCVADEVVGRGFGRRFMEATEQFSRGRVQSFRVDTHADNRVMQSLLPRLGFQCCGTIRIDGRPFEAFEKIIE